jgi:hypothetical protein
MDTPSLIRLLVEDAAPVRRLRSPGVRAVQWLALAAFIVVLLAISHGVRPDLTERLPEASFVLSIAASLATGVLAAVAAFLVSLPDRSPRWLLLPVPALVLWLLTVGYSCLFNWVSIGPDGLQVGESARCFATLALTSLPLNLAMGMMVRHASALNPGPVSLAAGLAVAGIAATALALLHNLDATAMVLIWNVGGAVAVMVCTRLLTRRVFEWSDHRIAGQLVH